MQYKKLKTEYNKVYMHSCELQAAYDNLQATSTQRSSFSAHTISAAQIAELVSSDPTPSDLSMANLNTYTNTLQQYIPVIVSAFALMLSVSFRRKERASSTHPKWLNWAYLYKAFLVDVVLRARLPKTVGRTNLLLGAFMVLGSLSEPCWRLLQRLCIVPSKQHVESWLKTYTKSLVSDTFFLLYVFDNCDLKRHVTHVRTEHRTEMIHLINRYV